MLTAALTSNASKCLARWVPLPCYLTWRVLCSASSGIKVRTSAVCCLQRGGGGRQSDRTVRARGGQGCGDGGDLAGHRRSFPTANSVGGEHDPAQRPGLSPALWTAPSRPSFPENPSAGAPTRRPRRSLGSSARSSRAHNYGGARAPTDRRSQIGSRRANRPDVGSRAVQPARQVACRRRHWRRTLCGTPLAAPPPYLTLVHLLRPRQQCIQKSGVGLWEALQKYMVAACAQRRATRGFSLARRRRRAPC